MSIITKLGWVALTFIVGGFVSGIAMVITAISEILRIIKYAWFKFVVMVAHWINLKNEYIYDLNDFVTRVADEDADKASEFRNWEFTQWKKRKS